jgi:hypothetical protein
LDEAFVLFHVAFQLDQIEALWLWFGLILEQFGFLWTDKETEWLELSVAAKVHIVKSFVNGKLGKLWGVELGVDHNFEFLSEALIILDLNFTFTLNIEFINLYQFSIWSTLTTIISGFDLNFIKLFALGKWILLSLLRL